MAHLTCTGGIFGGGERAAQSIMEYHVPGGIFPIESHYVALGHLHRRQRIPAPAPVHYSGAPMADRLRRAGQHQRRLPGRGHPGHAGAGHRPADHVRPAAPYGHRDGRGILIDAADSYGEDYLRVWVRQAQYAGMREQLLDALPNALEIRIDPQFAAELHPDTDRGSRAARTPAELFADYCAGIGMNDDRVARLFDELHDELSGRS